MARATLIVFQILTAKEGTEMNTYRITHEELQKEALRTGHKFQKAKVQLMMNVGWTCYAVESMGGIDLVMMTMKGKGTFGVVYPDGSFTRNQVGRKTVEFSWKRAREAAHATVPACPKVAALMAAL